MPDFHCQHPPSLLDLFYWDAPGTENVCEPVEPADAAEIQRDLSG